MRILKLSALAAALVIAAGANAQTLSLQRSAADLVPSALVAPKSSALADVEQQAVHFAWALDADAALSAPQPHVADSREFWTQLDADRAKRGFGFTPTADGALVRISSQGGAKAGGIAIDDLSIRADGELLDTASAVQHAAGDAELKAAGAVFSEGTMVFQLAPGLAGKRIDVALPKSTAGVLMHVLEPQSRVSMQLSADSLQASAGGKLELSASFADAGNSVPAQRIAGLITAPDGRSFELEFVLDKSGRGVARFELPADAGGGMEPWEIHAFGASALGKAQVLRDARTAVMVSQPNARLLGSADLKALDGGVAVQLPVETSSTGRFELRGTLYGSNSQGELKPMAIAHSAEVLAAGRGTLELRFPADVLNGALGAPYALRDLNLSDQSRMSLSERRQHALEITDLPR
jgi:hypothetical protein